MRPIRAAIAAATAGAVALLTACAPPEVSTPPQETPEVTSQPIPDVPTLRVPETTSASNVTLEVSAGAVDEPTDATIYRYDAEDWDAATIDCTAEPDDTQEVTLPAGGEWQTVTLTVDPGVIAWVLVTDDYTTPCGEDAALTRVLVEPDIGVYVDEDQSPVVGAPFNITVFGTSVAPSIPTPVTVEVYGPWESQPAAAAADCTSGNLAFSGEVELTDGAGGAAPVDLEASIDEPGVYLLVGTAPETEQTAAFTTCTESVETDDLFSVREA